MIFMATAIASETGPSDFNGISMIADGINHLTPTHKEIQAWFISQGWLMWIDEKNPRGGTQWTKAGRGALRSLARGEYERTS